MNRKKLICLIISLCMLTSLTSCVKKASIYNKYWPRIGFSFDESFYNWGDEEITVNSYGNLAYNNDGVIKKSLKITDGYLEMQNCSKIVLKDSFSFSTWFKLDDLSSCEDPIFFGKADSSGNVENGPLSIHFSDNYSFLRTDITFQMKDGTYKSHSFSSDFAFVKSNLTNSWNNIIVVFDKDKLTYYLNGKTLNQENLPESIKGYATIATNTNPYFIGKSATGRFSGYLDELTFYEKAIPQELIDDIYAQIKDKYKNSLTIQLDSNKVVKNNKTIQAPMDMVKSDATEQILIPLRFFIEQMGGKCSYDEKDSYGRVDIDYKDNKISVWVMDSNAIINNQHIKLSSYPTEYNENICVTLDFLSKELGADIRYSESESTYTIKY